MKPHQRPPSSQRTPSANRIRERYLHQLGLQRGNGGINSNNSNSSSLLPPPHQQRVVVIGLPSLPEERDIVLPTAGCNPAALQSHDFSTNNYKNSNDTQQLSSDGGESITSEEASSKRSREFNVDNSANDSNSFKKSRQNDDTTTNNNTSSSNAVDITSMALHYPKAVLKNPFKDAAASYAAFFANNNNTDHDSVGSSATSTTAGSSFTNHTLVSKDWGNHPNTTTTVPSSEDSSALLHGVHYNSSNNPSTTTTTSLFHPSLNNNNGSSTCCPTTSSLTHAMNRFNIDSQSDCDTTSLASHCSMDDHSQEYYYNDNNETTVVPLGSPPSGVGHCNSKRRKKSGKAQRLLDRAVAHDRILQIRCERSKAIRNDKISSSRHNSEGGTRSRSSSLGSSASCSHSLPMPALLHHVQHGNHTTEELQTAPPLPVVTSSDLSRTPVASNCIRHELKSYHPGVHISTLVNNNGSHPSSSSSSNNPSNNGSSLRPLGFHPLLVSNVPQAPDAEIVTTTKQQEQDDDPRDNYERQDAMETEEEEGLAHRRQSSIDDVLEVAEALAKLSKGRTTGSMIPRIR